MFAVCLASTSTAGASRLATPAAACTPKPYAYAGLFSNRLAHGIRATLTTLATPTVADGHVAGWIGVGGVSDGPNGQAEWLQAGVDTIVGSGSELYAETTVPGSGTTYKTLLADVAPGTHYRLAVLELPGRPNVWQVWLNGKPVTDPVVLPGSKNFAPMAMSESWSGGTPTCNGFAYRFDQITIAPRMGDWRPLTDVSALADTGYRVIDHTHNSFTAESA